MLFISFFLLEKYIRTAQFLNLIVLLRALRKSYSYATDRGHYYYYYRTRESFGQERKKTTGLHDVSNVFIKACANRVEHYCIILVAPRASIGGLLVCSDG